MIDDVLFKKLPEQLSWFDDTAGFQSAFIANATAFQYFVYMVRQLSFN